ncbi:LytR family transcriptional regulator [Streptomyces avermitilis]|uniref:LytR family transcriptional regulator n=1 Tax=Streptomyces avermitilis TaxID=33903 RepID=A0A4D4MRB3_STRAX|nr:LCP family protein [Streptomyces avermitilis]MYT00617.1 LytR family transcriptional regulator [Streptomyces sp. SID5469]KUN52396.1 LytR family transcriptional regulator [Streptomyces avermitilis]OOV30290.1 LytR family transcriptional regulator [Streptomyces avermitilis]BBJ53126.1 LytR family transcriptional regulator [Streptomyces avermitilis]GDY65143.1 LytR family transcriptional regulator [Streptomyces avermitilis]
MDAQGRGRADNIDPADQWVLNPDTGEYELRLSSSGPQSSVPGPRRSASRSSAGRARSAAPGRDTRQSPAPDLVPGPRRRRGVPDEPPPGRRRGRTKPKKSRTKKIVLWTGGSMAFVLVAVTAAGYLYLKHLEGNVQTTDVGDAAKSSFSKDDAFNILIIGTDKRTGAGNEGYGDKGSVGHADTNILLHVSKDRTNATALSIPRDLIVDVPDCETKQADGSKKVIGGSQNVRFNTSLGQGGRDAGCTMRTVKAVTGISPDHFMMADFNAVKTLTSAVDGVTVCVGKAVNDPDSHLKLPKGESTLEGEQALAFLRTRHSFGNQGDLDRIKVQQQFLGALSRKMTSSDTLTNPKKLLDLAEAATKALTVDTGIGKVSTLKDVALELKKVPPKNITFTTVPVIDNPAEKVHATVVVNQTTAPQVFSMIKDDVSFTAVKQEKKKEKAAVAARLKGSRSAASDVRVDIYNGGAPSGAAQETLSWLQNTEGVTKSSQLGNAGKTLSKTTLEYSPDQADQARKLADLMGLPAAQMKPGKSEKNAQGLPAIVLTLGKDFKGAGEPLTTPSKAPENIQKATADKQVCST